MTPRQKTAYTDPVAFSEGAPKLKFRRIHIEKGAVWCSILTVNK